MRAYDGTYRVHASFCLTNRTLRVRLQLVAYPHNMAGEKAGLSLRCRYLAGERRPHLSVDDDGRGVVAMRVAYRYSTILRRTRSRGGNRAKATGNGDGADSCDAVEHPVEAFVQNKLANDFTETGTAAIQRYLKRRATQGAASRSGYAHSGLEYRGSRGRSSAGSGSGGRDKYQKLLIPGTIYHMKKRGPEPQPGSGGAAASNAPMVLGGTPAEERHDTEYWMEREPPEEVCGCVCERCCFCFLCCFCLICRYR